MTDREAMQQALEALGWTDEWRPDGLKEQAIAALRERLAQPEQERWVWRNAAIRVGEELSSVGPVGYYDMTAAQWLDWAMAQEPRGKNSLAQPEPIKESSVTHSHLWIGDLYGKEKNT